MPEDVGRHDLGEAEHELRKADVIDKEADKERLRERRRRRKLRMKELAGEAEGDVVVATLGGADDGDDNDSDGDSDGAGVRAVAPSRLARSKRRLMGGDDDAEADDASIKKQRPDEDEDLALWLLQNS